MHYMEIPGILFRMPSQTKNREYFVCMANGRRRRGHQPDRFVAGFREGECFFWKERDVTEALFAI